MRSSPPATATPAPTRPTSSIPGNAAVTTEGAGLYNGLDTLAGPAATVPVGTRLRVVDQPIQPTAEGATLVQVEGLDDPSIAGFMLATDLAPRDSSAPVVRALEPGGPFSPNGDGQVDSTTIKSRFTETVAWTLRVRNAADDLVFETSGSGATVEAVWNGLVDGDPVPDGTYTVSVSGVDGWDNAPANATRSVRVDTKAPALEGLAPGADTTQWFSPERRRLPRHGLRQREERRDRHAHRPRPRRRRRDRQDLDRRATGAPPRR